MYVLQPATSARERSPSKDDTAAEAADTNMPAATNQSRFSLLILAGCQLDILDEVAVIVQVLAPLPVELLGQLAVLLVALLPLELFSPTISL